MMASAPLTRRTQHPAPNVSLWDEIHLPLARVHEVCGAARRTLALQIAARAGAPVIWIAPDWGSDPLNPCGMSRLIAPGHVLFVTPGRVDEMLWCMEESLRSGAAPVVVADLNAPPGMTPVRRLHLAAQTGAGAGRCHPLGLLLTPDQGGAPGIETRWHMAPAHPVQGSAWRLERLRARMAPPKVWRVTDKGIGPWTADMDHPRVAFADPA